jgi:hypothetical protein
MVNWTIDQLVAHATKSSRKVQAPRTEPAVRPGIHGKIQRAPEGAPRIAVRIVAYRAKLLDPDNLTAKFLIDGLRYAGALPGDSPEQIEYAIGQVLCQKDEERTEIQIDYPEQP